MRGKASEERTIVKTEDEDADLLLAKERGDESGQSGTHVATHDTTERGGRAYQVITPIKLRHLMRD